METVISGRLPFSRGKTGKEDVEKSAQVLEQFGLSDYAFRQMGQLSGGERQRIAIARAVLKNAPIVILDEATAYIDAENEALIQEAMAKVIAGKTVLMIAHRLSTITDADKIVVIKDGQIIDEGTHENLLTSCTLYQEMWKAHMDTKDVA